MSQRPTMKLIPQNKYPKKIHVGCEVYKILFVKMKDYGETDSGTRTIKIKKGLSPRETLRTFIHEMIHCAEFEFDIPLKHKVVYKLEEALFNMLFDNFL